MSDQQLHMSQKEMIPLKRDFTVKQNKNDFFKESGLKRMNMIIGFKNFEENIINKQNAFKGFKDKNQDDFSLEKQMF